MKISRALVVLLVAAAPGCILFGVGDLEGNGDAGAIDSGSESSFVDTSTIDAAADSSAPTDATLDTGTAFDCKSIDATFCDSFDRDAAIAVGAPWTYANTRPGCTIEVDGKLTTTFDASTGQQNCYLVSNPVTPPNGHFVLDFDLNYATDTSSASLILVAQLVVGLPKPNDAGLEDQVFQLLLNGTGAGRAGMFDFFPDAAQSAQPGSSYVAYVFGNATPFAQPSPPCHITWNIDALTPTATATSTCDGAVSTTLPSGSTKPESGFAGAATLDLGFANPETTAPAWSITYDNLIFRAAP